MLDVDICGPSIPRILGVEGEQVRRYESQRDFQQCGILTSVDSEELVQPPFKLRNSKWCSVNSLSVIKYSSD